MTAAGTVAQRAAPAGDALDESQTRAELAARLRVVVARLGRRGRRVHRGGLTASQLSALVAIECHGDVRVGDLAAVEGIAAPTMTRLVAGLVDGGLVERRPDPADGRSVRVVLTETGTRKLEELRRQGTTALMRAIERLDADHYARLAAAVPVLESLLDEPPAG